MDYRTFPAERAATGDENEAARWRRYRMMGFIVIVAGTLGTVLSVPTVLGATQPVNADTSASLWTVVVLDGSPVGSLVKLSCSSTSCAGATLETGIIEPRDVTVDGGAAFWAERSRVRRVDLETFVVETILNISATALAVDAGTVYMVARSAAGSSFEVIAWSGESTKFLFPLQNDIPVSLVVDGSMLWVVADAPDVDPDVGYLTGKMLAAQITDGPADSATYLRGLPAPRDASKRCTAHNFIFLLCAKQDEMQIVRVDLSAASGAQPEYDKSDFVSIVPKTAVPANSTFLPKVAASDDALFFTSGTALMFLPLNHGLPVGDVVELDQSNLLLSGPASLAIVPETFARTAATPRIMQRPPRLRGFDSNYTSIV